MPVALTVVILAAAGAAGCKKQCVVGYVGAGGAGGAGGGGGEGGAGGADAMQPIYGNCPSSSSDIG